ncbi:hypothetical protein P153DRAFT_130608 [Dothidotthia symphoricarpi CBS 119687]|uniref:Uncharacterized protein n=1 Tax=Dothidotthia symphoricarpi CBS 119687 TaxID=1392245 RepID=A0A6A5ZXQ7_9PLEO|nr:uncharacterized protein P153DRAFT_130608 [Dothidotthia symphoricarpi CBS 119687]KAF2124370.1 hypothetical protein P153DRAFT_130608 [Dothidotthia symphoricarpi CBS 119687]
MATLIDLLDARYAPIQTCMLQYLGVGEVVALQRTCKAFGALQERLMATSYNINLRLSHFFRDPREFRSLLGKCNAVIADEFARRFFSRLNEAEYELMIFVAKDMYAVLAEYLRGEGYTHEEGFFEFVREDSSGCGYIVYMENNPRDDTWAPLAQVLDSAYTTCCLNLITWNKAYSLFPYRIFMKQESHLLVEFDPDIAYHWRRLEHEGIKSKTIEWSQKEDSHPITCPRRVGDKYTWVINLDTQGIETPELPDEVLETATFQIRLWDKDHDTGRGPVMRYILDFRELRHPVLKYPYIVLREPSTVSPSAFRQKCKALEKRLDELTLFQLLLIHPACRPSEYDQLANDEVKANQLRGKFELPASWTFYDADVVEFLTDAWNDWEEGGGKKRA